MDPEGSHFWGQIVQLQGRYSSRYYETEPAVAMADHGTMTEISFAGRFSSSAIAACFAEVPRSLAPSLQEKAATDAMAMPKYRGMLATVATIARKE
ncbi:hypothetical protein BHE74_00015346 [Ensete ventricosum]|nr:hypothetical protein GW17_00051215 [Ensete ventricosum]RWW76544.1 hypothetical protein BHE74_00015346 [Ensete ventricosum]